ncbi:liprin-beta-2b [Thalassophryne amazonica]|uniref:liprin-beta-2b n=1 Tax=Thalassophryne amazonica TaxID=390379 RepID=UPI0014708ED0|nr:liprin-beta-2b [Thalassophryne amazonica]
MLPSVTMETEASHMLEQALEQMDDIIAGSKAAEMEYSNSLYDLGSPISPGPLQVIQLAEDLKLALELQPDQEQRDSIRTQIPTDTAQALMDWLQSGPVNQSSASNETYQERLVRLEGDKESLVLQVSILTDQVETQGEKIKDLESSLEEHWHKLASTEDLLQQELVSRTSLETQKLDLINEVSLLKLKLVNMEEADTKTQPQDATEAEQNKAECVVNFISELQEQMCRFHEEISTRIQEKRALEETEAQQGTPRVQSPNAALADLNPDWGDTWRQSEGHTVHDLLQEVKLLKCKVEDLEGEKSQYERKLRATKVEISGLQQLLASKDAEIECLQTQLLARGSTGNDSAEREEVYIKHLIHKYQEYQRLKVGMESLLASNDKKDRRIEELTSLLHQYRRMREIMLLTRGSSDEELSCNLKLRAIAHKAHSDIVRSEVSSRGSSPLMSSSSAFQRELDSSILSTMNSSVGSTGDTSFLNGCGPGAGSCPALSKGSELRAELNGNRERDSGSLSPVQLSPLHDHEHGLIRCRSASAPALGSPEKHGLCDVGRPEKLEECVLSDQSPLSSGVDSGDQSPVSPEHRKSHRGIKKLWGKIRRSQSGSPVQVHDPELVEFKRGGFRATAGPRLARTENTRDLKIHFSKWNMEQVCDWLEDIGLGQYGILARQWVTSGQTLMSAGPPTSRGKGAGDENPLHRKKLQLAIKTFSSKQHEKSSELDYIWVTRWLDDIGLPQYKDQFNEGRVDGHMLQYLTVNDLLFLKVTSQLHHLSIKCAIHVLHINKFNPNCLKRRPSNESQVTPTEVMQWSNHRVMEWLRSVDLAEYAPNLRGSGVHGGLIILEPRFNWDTLAMILNIQPQKTLLRRHLTTNFCNLVGPRAQQEKREHVEAAGYSPLSTTAKVKPKKLVFSNLTHLRRRRADGSTDYVCPVEAPSPPSGSDQAAVNGLQSRPYAGFRGLSPILDREPDRTRDQVRLDDCRHQPSP